MMNYDITFCEGENCQRKEECHRYRELQRFRADKDPHKKTYISMCKPTNPTKCTLFWREKNEALMEKINGICIEGKIYKAVRGECKDCDLQGQCKENDLFNDLCNFYEDYNPKVTRIFRYSQELTDKINKKC